MHIIFITENLSMTNQKITKARLLLNGIGSAGIAILCLPIGLPGIIGLLSGHAAAAADPDGAGKVQAIELFCAALGMVALISLVRTVIAWRRLPKT
jgi:hypothetical protein